MDINYIKDDSYVRYYDYIIGYNCLIDFQSNHKL